MTEFRPVPTTRGSMPLGQLPMPAPGAVGVVPEPASIVLVVLGLLSALSVVAYRRAK